MGLRCAERPWFAKEPRPVGLAGRVGNRLAGIVEPHGLPDRPERSPVHRGAPGHARQQESAENRLLESNRAWVSSLHSCEFFVFSAKIREAFLLGKAPSEWLSLMLIKDALYRHRRELKVPVAEMVNRRA